MVGLGEGTSFATPHVAALAAHWLQRNGRQNLLDSFAGIPLQHVYRTLLRQTARVPQGWDTANFGAGIIDAGALVCAGPPVVPAPPPWLLTFYTVLIFHSLPVLGISQEQFESYLERLLNVERTHLSDWLEYYGEELVRSIFETPSATAAFVENVETWQAAAAEGPAAAASHTATVVHEVRDKVSDTLKSAAGWIS